VALRTVPVAWRVAVRSTSLAIRFKDPRS